MSTFSLFTKIRKTKENTIIDEKKKAEKTTNMSVYNHRPMGPPTPSRLIELLDAVKGEYDQLAQEVIVCKNQRDEYEHKSKFFVWIISFKIQRVFTHFIK